MKLTDKACSAMTLSCLVIFAAFVIRVPGLSVQVQHFSHVDLCSELLSSMPTQCVCADWQAMERPTMGQLSAAPQSNDPFAASYNNLSGSGSGPSSQPSGQQYMHHPTGPQSYADMPQFQPPQPAQSHNPFAAVGNQPSFGSSSFASSGEHNFCHNSCISDALLHYPPC